MNPVVELALVCPWPPLTKERSSSSDEDDNAEERIALATSCAVVGKTTTLAFFPYCSPQ